MISNIVFKVDIMNMFGEGSIHEYKSGWKRVSRDDEVDSGDIEIGQELGRLQKAVEDLNTRVTSLVKIDELESVLNKNSKTFIELMEEVEKIKKQFGSMQLDFLTYRSLVDSQLSLIPEIMDLLKKNFAENLSNQKSFMGNIFKKSSK